MKPKKIDINLQIRNNSNLSQDINILGNPPAIGYSDNSTVVYSFDLSGETFNLVNYVQLKYSTIVNPSIVSSIAGISNLTIAGVVQILNSFNVGIFTNTGGVIYVNSSYYQYAEIKLAKK